MEAVGNNGSFITIHVEGLTCVNIRGYDVMTQSCPTLNLWTFQTWTPSLNFAFGKCILMSVTWTIKMALVLFPISILDDIVKHLLCHGNFTQLNASEWKHLIFGFHLPHIENTPKIFGLRRFSYILFYGTMWPSLTGVEKDASSTLWKPRVVCI